MEALAKAKGAEFDRLFLTGMIQHHTGALIMVEDLFNTPGAGQEPCCTILPPISITPSARRSRSCAAC